jgi:hypothetical protein
VVVSRSAADLVRVHVDSNKRGPSKDGAHPGNLLRKDTLAHNLHGNVGIFVLGPV